jgi:hypothetical protein
MNSNLLTSQLHDEKTFYQTFWRDLEGCTKEVIIESPYITTARMRTFDRLFKGLLKKGVKIYIITRNPREHEEFMESQSEDAITWCEMVGIQVLLCIGNHHRKLAIVDIHSLIYQYRHHKNTLCQLCREIQ